MECILYSTTDERRVLDKKLVPLYQFDDVVWIDDSNILYPAIRLDLPNDANLQSLNYLYIREFNRYYFVNNRIPVYNWTFEFKCEIDVLNTYKEEIKEVSGIINRANIFTNPLIDDEFKQAQANSVTVNKLFSGGELLTEINSLNHCFVVTTYGGVK